MPVDTLMEHIPLSKQRLLEFLGAQKGPITAKVASIDLDARASTVTEMLERCAAQGLVEREANQRPREYAITAAGRRRLAVLVPSEPESEPESTDNETNAFAREGSKKVRALLDRARKLHEIEAGGENMSESANQAKAGKHSEIIRNLYHDLYELRSLSFFDSKNEMRARIAELELHAGKEISDRLKRLVSLEVQIRNESGTDVLRAVLELRASLQFPAIVFGLAPET